MLDAWKIESLRTEWWYSFHLPVNWKLAEEAFVEQYHVLETHPQLRIPGRYPPRDGSFDPRVFVDSELHYLHVMSDGMAGMVHGDDVRIAEGLRQIELPADPALARSTWDRTLNDAVTSWHRAEGHEVPDLNELDAAGMNEPMGYGFPHFFVLPMYSSASSYRFRPLGPEETLMEIWSLTRFPEDSERPKPTPPEPWASDDPRVAAHSHAGFLEPPETATRPAHEGVRVHAPVRGDRGAHLELPPDDRRLPRRPSLRAAVAGAPPAEPQPTRTVRRRHRLLT